MYYVYVIESQKNLDLYKGFTISIRKRIKEHNERTVDSTKNFCPWKLIYCEILPDKADAIAREKYLKSSWGRKFIKEVLKNYLKNKKTQQAGLRHFPSYL
ncbi:MAG: hypothetical protein A3J76_02760 [Candidatus Moranbacteria bacterium RBG_13_45_13]|nr:MAG: hypothetical protein A3J76_02760 [Candidatus Moranbacteria bacterium RBG_13_45_13]